MPHMPAYVFFAVRASTSLVKNQKMTLLVQRQGRVIYSAQATLDNAETLVKLPMTNVPSGLVQVTLFDENTKPVCERLFFNINKNTALPLAADMGNSFAPRKQVTVNLKAGADADSLRAGSFSASVVNLGGLPSLKSNQSGILPGLLLNPELKGFVENPDHYFESADGMPDASHLTELDNLVLCQGWRRIVWDDVKAGNWNKPVHQPEKSFKVTGSVTHNNGNPAPNAKVALMSAKSFAAMDTISDANGHFVFDHLLLKDSMRLALQAKDGKGRNTLLIKADAQPGIKDAPPFTNIQFNEDAAYQTYLKKTYADMPDSIKLKLVGYRALKEVKITAVKTKKDLVPSISANLNGPGKADEVYLADEMKNSSDLYHFLDGRALGIMFTVDAMTKQATPYLSRTARSALAGNTPGAMKIYYDGVLMNEGTGFNIDDIPINNIASVEILRSTMYSALYDTNEGVIIITGKTADIRASEIQAAPGYLPLMLQGYQTPRQFYAPDYTVNPNTAADHRTTVYWKPDIVTDKQGNASFKFFTSDDKGTYRISIEGITADGRPAHLVKDIKVE